MSSYDRYIPVIYLHFNLSTGSRWPPNHITIGFIQWKSSLSRLSVLGSYSHQTRLLTAMLPLTVRPSGGPYRESATVRKIHNES